MTGPESWYLAAEARWQHLPAGDDRDRRVQATFLEIRDEAELVSLRLPELTDDEKRALIDEAVLDVHARYGLPLTDVADELFDLRVEHVYRRLQLRAREQKAPDRVKSKLLERRLLRSPGIRAYLGLAPE